MLQPGMVSRQLKTRVLEADRIALFISYWNLTQPGQAEKKLIATTVLRRQSDDG
jgi:hypothetical protein